MDLGVLRRGEGVRPASPLYHHSSILPRPANAASRPPPITPPLPRAFRLMRMLIMAPLTPSGLPPLPGGYLRWSPTWEWRLVSNRKRSRRLCLTSVSNTAKRSRMFSSDCQTPWAKSWVETKLNPLYLPAGGYLTGTCYRVQLHVFYEKIFVDAHVAVDYRDSIRKHPMDHLQQVVLVSIGQHQG